MFDRLNDPVRLRLLRQTLATLHFSAPVLWVYDPKEADLIEKLPRSILLYDCVDEFSEFPSHVGRKAFIRQQEQKLLRSADVVITVSESLYEDKRRFNSNTHLVPNVADAEHFAKAQNAETRIPGRTANIPKPIIGFVGALSDYKIDFPLLTHTARTRPEWQIVLIGPLQGDHLVREYGLDAHPNIHLLGWADYQVLPSYMKAFDVCIMPYRANEYTKNFQPLKIFEYMATGKPIVATNLRPLAPYRDAIRIAQDKDDFVRQVAAALGEHDPDLAERRLELARQNTWEKRIGRIMEIVQVESSTKGVRC